jgi:hypothetical protein
MFRLRKTQVEIPLYAVDIKEDGYHLFLEVTINGNKGVMLLDTGASRTVFDMHTLQQWHNDIPMEVNEDKATGLGSNQVESYVTSIDKLEIGEIVVNNFETGVLDLSHVNESYSNIDIPPIAGVFGSDLLMMFDAIISYKDRKLVLDKKRVLFS